MALAYRNMLYPIRHLPSSDEARILNVQIYEKVSETPAERKARAKEGLRSGELSTSYYDEMHWLRGRLGFSLPGHSQFSPFSDCLLPFP
jgi:hypothetical protein